MMNSDNADIEDSDSSSWESMDEEEDASHKIVHNSLILERVFGFLKNEHLLQSRLVCRHWNKVALLKNHLGSKVIVRITEENFPKFLELLPNISTPFCREFCFHMLELDSVRLSSFKKVFKHSLSSLSLKLCTNPAEEENPFEKLLNFPNLGELKIAGGLPDLQTDSSSFKYHHFKRLKNLELSSSIDFGQVSKQFLRIMMENCPNLHSIGIGRSASLLLDFVKIIVDSESLNFKLSDVRIFGVESALNSSELIGLQSKLGIQALTLEHCIVGQDFLQEVLGRMEGCLLKLSIIGAQHEILSRVFTEIRLKKLTNLTLPIDGVSVHDGATIIEAIPQLTSFEVVGLFNTIFTLNKGQLLSIVSEESDMNTIFTLDNFRIAIVSEKQRELVKVLKLLPVQAKKIHINLPFINSRCLRCIFQTHEGVEELTVLNNSRQCLDGWTGIPKQTCRKIASCRSFAVVDRAKIQKFSSIASLKKLKRLRLSILGEPPKSEFTLLYVVYGFSHVPALEELSLANFNVSDIALLSLSKSLKLKHCVIDGSEELWNNFKASPQHNKIRTFLLPPENASRIKYSTDPLKNPKLLGKILSYLPRNEIFSLRHLSKFWHKSTMTYLHGECNRSIKTVEDQMDEYLENAKKSSKESSPNQTPRKILTDSGEDNTPCLQRVLKFLEREPTISTLIFRGMNKSMLEYYQNQSRYGRCDFYSSENCQNMREISYWFYPDGREDFMVPRREEAPRPSTLIVIGSWGRKDTGLLEFLQPTLMISSVMLIGLFQEVYDLVLPKLTSMQNIESVTIKPFSSSCYTEINRNHLQILANASFSLKNLSMHRLKVPSETIADLIKAHRFTIETLDVQNNVNISDRLAFAIPHLKKLQLDEPPGVLLWSTLNMHQHLETISLERRGCVYNQMKTKPIPKLELLDHGLEHSATEILCDVNLFLESVATRRPGAQKSVLQEGSDSALRFVSHFRFLTSLTLRSVHAYYGILQGIFKTMTQLEKLVFTNTDNVTDEILTGFPKAVLEKMDLLNPLQITGLQNEMIDISYPSIRNLKSLTYLSLDDQHYCTDLSVIFGILKLKRLKFFSCKKWKITDVSVRAIADNTSMEKMVTDGSTGISTYGLEYFKNKLANRAASRSQRISESSY